MSNNSSNIVEIRMLWLVYRLSQDINIDRDFLTAYYWSSRATVSIAVQGY